MISSAPASATLSAEAAEKDHLQHEIETAANELLPGWIRRVELLQHDDAPMIEPGQMMPRLVFKDPAERPREPHPDPRKAAKAARTFKLAIGPGLNQFRDSLMQRWPQIRYIEVMTEDNAEAIRWALTRIRERPAYEQLREHTRDIDRLKSEF